jgi:hypothetical protein
MSTLYCEISNDLINDCLNPPISGSKGRMLVLSRKHVKSINKNSSNPVIIEAIVRKATALAYTGKALEYITDMPLKPSYAKVVSDFGHKYKQTISIPIKGLTPAARFELHKLGKESDGVIVILEQNYKGTTATPNAKWLVLGGDTGLFVESETDEENRNIATLVLASKDGMEEEFSSQHFYLTSEAVSDAAIEALTSTDLPPTP